MAKIAKNQVELRTIARTWHYYWQATKKHGWLTFITFASTLFVEVFRNVGMQYLMAQIVAGVADNPSVEFIWQKLVPLAVVIVVLRILLGSVLGEVRTYCHWKMEIYAMYELANLAFNTVSAQSMQFHSDRFSGSLVSQTNKFIGAYERLFDCLAWSAMPFLLILISALAVLYTQVPIYAFGLTIFVAIYALIAYAYFKKMAPLNEAHAAAETKRTGQLADSITNITAVKSYAQEKYERRRFARFAKTIAGAYMDVMRANIHRNVLFEFVYAGCNVILLAFLLGGQRWLGISFGTLYLVVTYTNTIVSELWDLNGIFKDFNRVFGDAREMTEILDMVDDVVDAPNAKKLVTGHTAEVQFARVTFKHADAKQPIFEDFSLTVKPGERIGLVGVSGSGKTTLTKLLLRFADVSGGAVMIDGQDIKFLTQESLRKAIAYVPQETALFHRTIAENIAYGKPGATMEKIVWAAKQANADEFIRELPDGYETLVGERGIKLSGGQRQRVAIARAILKDAPILVLDEATSALDSESEALIQDALNKLMQGRTSIVIAHRLSTVANMDRIVVLKDGMIAEQGSHQELLAKDGPYKHLWSRQSGVFLEEK